MSNTDKPPRRWGNVLKPFRLCGNIFFVGTVPASTHIIDTGCGLILIDSGYQETLYGVIDNIYQLGYNPRDIKYILHSHGHIDHSGATASLAELTGAKTIIGRADADMVMGKNDLVWAKELDMDYRCFTPDILLDDGNIIELGNTKIECVSTPGHTPGTFSFFWQTETSRGTLNAGMMGGLGRNTLKSWYLKKYDLEKENWRESYAESLKICLRRDVDINVGNHCSQNGTVEKAKQIELGNPDAFIDRNSWENMLNDAEIKFQQLLESDLL